MSGFKIDQNNIPTAKEELEMKIARALEMIGIQAEGYAKALCPVGTPESTGIPGYRGGTLRNSITHQVDMSVDGVYIGTNVEYAPYVELGTVKMKKRPYLKPAIEQHMNEYRTIALNELK